MSGQGGVLPSKELNDSKEMVGQQEDLEPSTVKITDKEHDAPVTAADIEFIENFAQSPQKARLMRKVDLRLLPVLILLYLVSFIGGSRCLPSILLGGSDLVCNPLRPKQHW